MFTHKTDLSTFLQQSNETIVRFVSVKNHAMVSFSVFPLKHLLQEIPMHRHYNNLITLISLTACRSDLWVFRLNDKL